MRYQQIFDASEFAQSTNGAWIHWLNFRPDANSGAFERVLSNVEIHLSTTLRPPDGLSAVFSENVGRDDTIVFSGSFLVGSTSSSAPEPWNVYNMADLTNYFWYDPRLGNLLMDVRVYDPIPGPAFPPFDAASSLGDTVSSVYSSSVNATSGVTDTTGLVTLISMLPVPSLKIHISTNYIAIRWPSEPTSFVLQQSSSLSPDTVWQSLPGVGGTNPAFREYQVPLNSAGPAAFFRLVGPAGTQ